jgi:hypothetical protein
MVGVICHRHEREMDDHQDRSARARPWDSSWLATTTLPS